MEPVTIAIICATVFGVVSALTAFIRLLLLSRDKKLNDTAQQRALVREANELEKLRVEMTSNKRFDSHYQVLGANKDAIRYLDQKIEEILKKKSELIQRYANATLKGSEAIIAGEHPPTCKAVCDQLKEEIDNQIKTYTIELEHLQQRRANLWDAHIELQEYLLDQEKIRNKNLDSIFQKHTGLLEKIYYRHIDNMETVTKSNQEAASSTFQYFISSPFNFLLNFFKLSTGISPDAAKQQLKNRKEIANFQTILNGDESRLVESDHDVVEKIKPVSEELLNASSESPRMVL